MKTLLGAANGRTGREVLQALVVRGQEVRALIRHEAQSKTLLDLGARDCAIGDLQDAATLRRAAEDCGTAIYIGPPMHADEVAMARSFYDAAHQAGCGHFVYYSVLHPVCRDIRHHRLKLEVEEIIVNGPLPFTIMQPARYMQHLEPLLPGIRATGVHAMPFSTEVRFNVVDLADVAEAVATVVCEASWRHGTYELAGPESLSQADMAVILTEVLGRRVEAQALSLTVMRERATKAGASADRIEQMALMNQHYDQHGMLGNPRVLELLLGRAPTSYARYAARVAGSSGTPA